MIKWTDIESLHNIRRNMVKYKALIDAGEIPLHEPGSYEPPTVTYRAKVKLHGTNGGIRVDVDGTVTAQSRTRDLTLEDDNYGFAKLVASGRFEQCRQDETVVIFGEWCGPGINKHCAIHAIESKVFAVFAVQVGDMLFTDPDDVLQLAGPSGIGPVGGVYVLPWHGRAVTVPFGNDNGAQHAADTINSMVLDVEACDPWVRDTFGVDGMGEGLVFYPQITSSNRNTVCRLIFKAKGEKHSVRKSKKPAEIDPEIVASVDAFVDTFVTEQRCQQAVQEACAGEYDRKLTGSFLKWIGQDVKKESIAELEASGLTWKQTGKPVAVAARTWWMGRAL